MNVPYVTGMHFLRPPISNMSLRVDGVDHAAGAEEEQRLEEGVRPEVEHTGRGGADGEAGHHVAELADGRVREHAFDVALDDGHAAPPCSIVIAR